ncbi:primary-amine oxidase [Micromonospora sp. NPDC048947]|uniref:copper amine oxidase n=1 Tax=Micromonospora sp. NPDC048947 TaxID=3154826 RepID=UPI00341097A0
MRLRASLAALALVAGMILIPRVAQAEDPQARCGAASMVAQTLPGGTRWRMCWHIDPQTGLVLEDVSVAYRSAPEPMRVLESITLGQLNVPYDSGQTEWNDITSFGFGGDAMQELTGRECPDGSRRAPYGGAARVLCVTADATGPAQRVNDTAEQTLYTREGHDLVLRTVSKVGWYEYLTEYRFGDGGRITARLGATGDLSPNDYTIAKAGWPIGEGQQDNAAAHHHNAIWRVDFDLAGGGGERVEQLDSTPTGRQGRNSAILELTRTPIPAEANLTTANRRWWRVVSTTSVNTDGHPRSYDLALGAGDVYESRPETRPDVSVTQQRACEKFATFNLDPECGARSVLQYVNGEQLTDPVMWVRIGFHHVPRDEDQSPMHTHWQGFDLNPRDFTATNPLAPSARATINGRP